MSTRNPGYEHPSIRLHRLLTTAAPQPKLPPMIPPLAPEATVADRVTALLEEASRTLQLSGMACRLIPRN